MNKKPNQTNDVKRRALTVEETREVKRRVREYGSPVWYTIVSMILPKRNLWFDVSTDTYCDQIEKGTMFKNKIYADSLLKVLSTEKNKKFHMVVKVTKKSGNIRIIKCFR